MKRIFFLVLLVAVFAMAMADVHHHKVREPHHHGHHGGGSIFDDAASLANGAADTLTGGIL